MSDSSDNNNEDDHPGDEFEVDWSSNNNDNNVDESALFDDDDHKLNVVPHIRQRVKGEEATNGSFAVNSAHHAIPDD